jgi:O-antigen/teichoic acid export membrane protein
MLLTKALNIRRQCVLGLISTIGSGAVAILLAWKGYGVWSLGLQSLTASVLGVILVWGCVSWRPRLIFAWQSIRGLFKFSSFLLLSNLSNTFFSRINALVIGKFYSATDLGHYSRADGLRLLPGDLLSEVINRVAFPIFSAAHEDKALLRAGLKKSITLVMMLNVPIMLGMLVTARPLVYVLFGAQWLPCVPYVRILCIGGMLWPLHILNLSVLTAQGHSNLFFRLEIIKKTLGILFLAAACPFGIMAIAWSVALGGFISFAINAYYSGRFLQYGMLRQVFDLLPIFTGALVMAACAWALSFLPIRPQIVMLAVQAAAGVIVYVLFCLIFKVKAFADVIAIAKSRLPQRAACGG